MQQVKAGKFLEISPADSHVWSALPTHCLWVGNGYQLYIKVRNGVGQKASFQWSLQIDIDH